MLLVSQVQNISPKYDKLTKRRTGYQSIVRNKKRTPRSID